MRDVRNIGLVWDQFGPQHMERSEALGRALHPIYTVHGIEIASRSQIYAWAESPLGHDFRKHTLFSGCVAEDVRANHKITKLIKLVWKEKIDCVFIANYHRLDTLIFSALLRLLGRRVYLMSVSKFDDMARAVWREALKSCILLLYNGAVVAGPRAEDYLRFLGFRRRSIVTGFNTVALDRLVAQAGRPAAPAGPAFGERHFVLVGRFVPKKDIATAIAAYARYRDLAGTGARQLHLCGSGPLEAEIKRQITDLELEGVVLHGFLQRDGIARVLSGGLAVIVPSIEEQWGLVVNEAIAFCLPILATDQVGARDLLVRTAVNGYIFEPGNVEGLARMMLRMGEDEGEWHRLVEGSRRLHDVADTEQFAKSVLALIEFQACERGCP